MTDAVSAHLSVAEQNQALLISERAYLHARCFSWWSRTPPTPRFNLDISRGYRPILPLREIEGGRKSGPSCYPRPTIVFSCSRRCSESLGMARTAQIDADGAPRRTAGEWSRPKSGQSVDSSCAPRDALIADLSVPKQTQALWVSERAYLLSRHFM